MFQTNYNVALELGGFSPTDHILFYPTVSKSIISIKLDMMPDHGELLENNLDNAGYEKG